jgi:large subunit ribosomal protein L9
VTSQTVADELNRQGFQIERKRVELPGATFKSVGKYKAAVRLYESTAAEITVVVLAQIEKAKETPVRARRRRDEGPAAESAPAPEAAEIAADAAEITAAPEAVEAQAPAEAPAAPAPDTDTPQA